MAKFKITPTTTVAELKEQFRNEVGCVLRVYQGRSEASDGATLVSLGAKEGELECRTSRTVGKFEEAFQNDLNLKVKVYTKDNWVKVLDGITLAVAGQLPNGMTKAKMEEHLSYKRDEEETAEVVNEGHNEYILFVASESGTVIKSRDYSVEVTLQEGNNKVYLNKYPQFREGFEITKGSRYLTDIDFSHVSCMKVKNIDSMFSGTKNVRELNLSNFDTSELENYWFAFGNSGVEKIDLSGWDLSQFNDTDDLFYALEDNFSSVILNGCNVKTVANVRGALKYQKHPVSIIAEVDEIQSDLEDFTEDKMSDAISSDYIVVALKKIEANNISELHETVYEGDVQAVISCVNGQFHYICNQETEEQELEDVEIDFNNLYAILDYPIAINELKEENKPFLGIYLPEAAEEYYHSDRYPDSDSDLCFVIAEALTGDDTGNVLYCVDFNQHKVFICEDKIITECD